VLVLVLVACLAGCGSTAPTPGDIAENYVNTLASGDYASACGLLGGHVRQALLRAYGARSTCRNVFVHCLPNQATVLNKDQSQLLFANEDVSVTGHRASVTVSGTAVARRVKTVNLIERKGTWTLTSYGSGLSHCRAARHAKRHGA
jgi:hypothetical protein